MADNRKTFSVRVHEALYRAFIQALSLKALKFLQKMVLNIVFAGGEHATNLIIANIEVLSHDNRNSHSLSLDRHKRQERRARSASGASAERGERGTLRARQAEHTAGAQARTRT